MPSSRPGESRVEREKRRRLERGDTLPDVEDDVDDLVDIDEADDEITRV